MAAPTQTSPAPARDVTWRDAVTPLSRASRQRWTTSYALLLVAVAATTAWDGPVSLILFVGLGVVFGMLRRGTRRIAALDHPDLDERDIEARNRAYRIAFPLLVLVVVAALIMLAIAAPGIERSIGVRPEEHASMNGLFVEGPALLGLGLWIALWAVFLPTGVLAWSEPDAIEAEDGGPLPEARRDALLGLALTAGLAIDVVTHTGLGLLLFIGTLALLGGLARRASGQPMMSRQRKWRIAIGLTLLALFVAAALVLGRGSNEEGGIIDGGGSSVERTK